MKVIKDILIFFLFINICCGDEEKEVESPEEKLYGVKYAQDCEVCKYLVIELENRLSETGKSHDVIEIGYELDPSTRKKKKYAVSELRLVESLDGICDRLLDYNIHKERKDSTRFAKGMSTTFKVLHDLVDKGVKVELGIPEDLWDKPSAEITHLKMQCENLLEKHESDIENWYFHHQDTPLKEYLCVQRALQKGNHGCLDEALEIQDEKEKKGEKSSKKSLKASVKKSENKRPKEKGESKISNKKGENKKLNEKGETKDEL